MRFGVKVSTRRGERFAVVTVSDPAGQSSRRVVAAQPIMLYGVYPIPWWINRNWLSVGTEHYDGVIDALEAFVDGPDHDPVRFVMADALWRRDVQGIISAARRERLPHGETEIATAVRRLRAVEPPSRETAMLADALERAERLLPRAMAFKIIGRRSLEAVEAAAHLPTNAELDDTCAALRARLDTLIKLTEQHHPDELIVLAMYHRTEETHP